MLCRRAWLSAAGAGLAAAFLPDRADASVFRALSLPELVAGSRSVTVAKALEAYSLWENVAGRRRIVTYTRIGVQELVSGKDEQSELLVRTLGGQVGDLGQIVHGEAVLTVQEPSVVFVRERRDGTLGIMGLAQGHFPLAADAAGIQRLQRSPRLGELLSAKDAAVTRLAGRTLGDAKQLVREAARR